MDDDMKLPAGKRCDDCRHFPRCRWLLGRAGNETICDWSPSRFGSPGAMTREEWLRKMAEAEDKCESVTAGVPSAIEQQRIETLEARVKELERRVEGLERREALGWDKETKGGA